MLEVAAMLKENLRHLHKLSGTVLMPDFVTTIDKHIARLWPELMRLQTRSRAGCTWMSRWKSSLLQFTRELNALCNPLCVTKPVCARALFILSELGPVES